MLQWRALQFYLFNRKNATKRYVFKVELKHWLQNYEVFHKDRRPIAKVIDKGFLKIWIIYIFKKNIGKSKRQSNSRLFFVWQHTSGAMRYLLNLVHFPNGDFPGKLTQRDTRHEQEIIRSSIFSKQIATRLQKNEKDDSFNAQPIRESHKTEQLSWAIEKNRLILATILCGT